MMILFNNKQKEINVHRKKRKCIEFKRNRDVKDENDTSKITMRYRQGENSSYFTRNFLLPDMAQTYKKTLRFIVCILLHAYANFPSINTWI